MKTPENTLNETPRKSKLTIIILSVIVALLVCVSGFFIYWINRPIYIIDKAFANGCDLTTIQQYYPKLKGEDLASVNQRLISYADRLYDDYYDEDEDYDTVSSIYEKLGNNMLKHNSEFQELQDKLEELKLSRDSFSSAQAAYNSGDYISAMEYCQNVSQKDRNYDAAQKLYEDSRRLNVIGDWTSSIDLSEIIANVLGEELDEPVSIPVELICTFNADGTGTFTYDIADRDALISSLRDVAFQVFIKQLALAYGVDRAWLESAANLLGFADIYSMYNSQVNGDDIESMVNELLDINREFTYTINDSSIDMELEDLHSTLNMESDGSLTLSESDAKYLFEVTSIRLVKKTAAF